MNIKKKFILSNIMVMGLPILLIGIMTVIFTAVFIMTYPVAEFHISAVDLLRPSYMVSVFGGMIENEPSMIKYIFAWTVGAVLIIVGVSTINTVILSRSILKPIAELTVAAERMKNGDFNVDIMRTSDEEINRLCVAFDEMRIQLKQGRDAENAHIEERKMLLANLSHDLRTPITTIKGYIEGIRDGVADNPEKLEKYLGTIYQKAEFMEDMIENMSMFSELETGRMQFDFEIGDINDLLRQLAQEYKTELDKNNMSICTSLSETPAVIKIDFHKMRRMFCNLIENAVKYRKDGEGRITLTSEIQNSGVLVSVSDRGIGIKESDIKHIFEGFYRSDPARNLNIKGNGLGLGIAKQITEAHGGKIWAKSEKGEGTTIFVYLPLRSDTDEQDFDC